MEGNQKSLRPLKPESDFIVETTDLYVRLSRPDGIVEEISWDELTGFDIETNSLGPLAPDVYWILHRKKRACIFPQGATGDGELLERLQRLSGFDNEAFIESMSFTEEAIFQIWRKPIP